MPLLTRWFIKAALLYFAAALAVGLVLVIQPRLPRLRSPSMPGPL